jgi:hypothetical protein
VRGDLEELDEAVEVEDASEKQEGDPLDELECVLKVDRSSNF